VFPSVVRPEGWMEEVVDCDRVWCQITTMPSLASGVCRLVRLLHPILVGRVHKRTNPHFNRTRNNLRQAHDYPRALEFFRFHVLWTSIWNNPDISVLQTMQQISYMRHQDLQWTRNLQRRDVYSMSSGQVLGSPRCTEARARGFFHALLVCSVVHANANCVCTVLSESRLLQSPSPNPIENVKLKGTRNLQLGSGLLNLQRKPNKRPVGR